MTGLNGATPVDSPHVLGVQGRYFVIALPMAAIFMASLINLELPRGMPPLIGIAGSMIAGITTWTRCCKHTGDVPGAGHVQHSVSQFRAHAGARNLALTQHHALLAHGLADYGNDRTRSILLAVTLGAAILGGLTLVWLAVDGGVRPKGASAAPTSPQNTALAESRELVDRRH